jgi:hypothetical protein
VSAGTSSGVAEGGGTGMSGKGAKDATSTNEDVVAATKSLVKQARQGTS